MEYFCIKYVREIKIKKKLRSHMHYCNYLKLRAKRAKIFKLLTGALKVYMLKRGAPKIYMLKRVGEGHRNLHAKEGWRGHNCKA